MVSMHLCVYTVYMVGIRVYHNTWIRTSSPGTHFNHSFLVSYKFHSDGYKTSCVCEINDIFDLCEITFCQDLNWKPFCA